MSYCWIAGCTASFIIQKLINAMRLNSATVLGYNCIIWKQNAFYTVSLFFSSSAPASLFVHLWKAVDIIWRCGGPLKINPDYFCSFPVLIKGYWPKSLTLFFSQWKLTELLRISSIFCFHFSFRASIHFSILALGTISSNRIITKKILK